MTATTAVTNIANEMNLRPFKLCLVRPAQFVKCRRFLAGLTS